MYTVSCILRMPIGTCLLGLQQAAIQPSERHSALKKTISTLPFQATTSNSRSSVCCPSGGLVQMKSLHQVLHTLWSYNLFAPQMTESLFFCFLLPVMLLLLLPRRLCLRLPLLQKWLHATQSRQHCPAEGRVYCPDVMCWKSRRI